MGYRIGRKDGEQESMDYLEFIARVTSHIPDKGQVMVRYYGLYANDFLDAGIRDGSYYRSSPSIVFSRAPAPG